MFPRPFEVVSRAYRNRASSTLDGITIHTLVGAPSVVQSLSSVHCGGVARARARRGRISLESETGRVLTV